MYSYFGRILLTISSLSPTLVLLWIVDTVKRFSHVRIYLAMDSLRSLEQGMLELLQYNYLLIVFLIIVLLTRQMVIFALNRLSTIPLAVKSIKPADINLTPVVFTILLSVGKIPFRQEETYIFLIIFILLALVFAIAMNNSYHFNPLLRLFGYRNYEIQTRADIAYLLLSKQTLINVNQVTSCIKLSHHMLLHVTR